MAERREINNMKPLFAAAMFYCTFKIYRRKN